ncbi:hypothetical protein [Heyndrickxia coagulans]|uniref:hypothetical protein n=1 Tax=Heyndrickxia coagulans TaxID=1398 RepID=UPI0018A7DA57|nr:hypothetical protein [Heyndrickxia coagulans]MBF8418926.1 hypothetical protein [Heyndrickxia coagulans]
MAKYDLNTKEQHFATTRLEAEAIVTDAKEDKHLTSWKIQEKHNKFGEYFLVDLTFTYNTPKGLMEVE